MGMLAAALDQRGYEVSTARDGTEALAVLQDGDIRMVVSDWVMPVMDGVELCKRIRNGILDGYVYVILLTARDRTEDLVEGLSAGADDFVRKPFEPAELYSRIKVGERILSLETRHVAIFAMAKLAESRDPETGLHLERIREYSRILAQYLSSQEGFRDQIRPGFVEDIYLTSPLHDIGKVGIPDCVLLKPGRLSNAEFETMKAHTVVGGNTLGAALRSYPGVEYLDMAKEIAFRHHERFDGTGYPDRLAAEQIPLCGRIVAVADVYDALTSKRVYKEAFMPDIARSIILEARGTHFDPRVVDAFILHEQAFLAAKEEHREERAVV